MERDFDTVISNLNFETENGSKNYYGLEKNKHTKLIKDELAKSSPNYRNIELLRRKLFLVRYEGELAERDYRRVMNSYNSFKDEYEMICYLRLYINNVILSLKNSPESIQFKAFEMLKDGKDDSLSKLVKDEADKLYSKKSGKKQSIKKIEKKFITDLKSLGKYKIINKMIDLKDKYPDNYISVKDALLFRYFNYDDLLSEVKSEINERLLDDNKNVVISGLNELQENNKDSENNILLHKLRDIVFEDNEDYDSSKLGEYYEKLFFVSKTEEVINYLNGLNKVFSKVESIKGNVLFNKVIEITNYLEEYRDSILSSFNYIYLKEFINYYTKINNLNDPYNSPKSDSELEIRKKKINEMIPEVTAFANKLGILKESVIKRRSR